MIKLKIGETLVSESNLKPQLGNLLKQCQSFLTFLKKGNDDYGKTDDQIAQKYNITPADFGNNVTNYNNVIRNLLNER